MCILQKWKSQQLEILIRTNYIFISDIIRAAAVAVAVAAAACVAHHVRFVALS